MSARASLVGIVVGAALLTFGCESAIVGSECAAPLVRCGRYCVDLQSDQLNCGVCGNVCNVACTAGVCTFADAGTAGDAGPRDAGRRDAGRDTGIDDAGTDVGTDAAIVDAGSDAGDVDGGGPRCDLGELLCGGSCEDGRDGDHCGDCATTCSGTDVCLAGACATDCGSLLACGTRCVDPMLDGHHCGDCATDCGSDVCVGGACTSAPPGHLVLIGHDYESRRFAMSTMLGNAIFLSTRASVRLLAYEVDSTAAAIAGTDAAIAESTVASPLTRSVAPDADSVPVLLDAADVFLVYGQAGASDATLRATGYAWHDALAGFLQRGGVVIVLEAPSLSNGGTYQILVEAGLFDAVAVSELSMPRLVAASGRASDPVLASVGFPYVGERHTARISTVDPDVIVTTGTDAVVFHRVVTH